MAMAAKMTNDTVEVRRPIAYIGKPLPLQRIDLALEYLPGSLKVGRKEVGRGAQWVFQGV